MEIVAFFDHHSSWLARLVLAVLLGGIIGFEREYSGRPAGFRTHIVVCVGACLVTLVDAALFSGTQGKIAGQVITGVGFLGAGTILRSDRGSSVHGLTTAASIWTMAGVGVALGFGPPTMWYACFTVLILIVTLACAGTFEDTVLRRFHIHRLNATVKSEDSETSTAAMLAKMAALGTKLVSVTFDDVGAVGPERTVHIMIKITPGHSVESLSQQLAPVAGLVHLSWDDIP